tara:strand:+ start:257 stop:706 length:450 start_codon:yes stop_codon:yes gene_type:complete
MSKTLQPKPATETLAEFLDGLQSTATYIPEAMWVSAMDSVWDEQRRDKANSIWAVPAHGPFEAGDDGTHYYVAGIQKGLPALFICAQNDVKRVGGKVVGNASNIVSQWRVFAFISFADQPAIDEAVSTIRIMRRSVTVASANDFMDSLG